MLFYILTLYVFVDGFLINAQGHEVIFNIENNKCTSENKTLYVEVGEQLNVGCYSEKFVNEGSCSVNLSGIETNLMSFKNEQPSPANNSTIHFSPFTIKEVSIGQWKCEFKTLKDVNGPFPTVRGPDNSTYKSTICYMNLSSKKKESTDLTLYYCIGAGAIVSVIILAQTGVILYFKAQAQRIARASKTTDQNDSGTNVYVTTCERRKKKFKSTKNNNSEETAIYETLEDAVRLSPPTPPISTIPTLKSPQLSTPKNRGPVTPQQTPQGTLKKGNTFEKDISKRPPLPLPKNLSDEPTPPIPPVVNVSTIRSPVSTRHLPPQPLLHNEQGTLRKDKKDPSKRPPIPLPKDLPSKENTIERDPSKRPPLPKTLPSEVTSTKPCQAGVKSELENIFKNKNANGAKADIAKPTGSVNKSKPLHSKAGPVNVTTELDTIFKNKNASTFKKASASPLASRKVPAPSIKPIPGHTSNKNPVPVPPKPVKPQLPGFIPELQPQPQLPRPKPAGPNRPLPPPPLQNQTISKPPLPSPPAVEESVYEEYEEEVEYEEFDENRQDQRRHSPKPQDSSDDEWQFEELSQVNLYSI